MRGVGFTYKERAVFNRTRKDQSQIEIVKGLKITAGRVSQLWGQAIAKVQKHLKNKRRPVAYCLKCGEKLKGRNHKYMQRWFCSRQCSDAMGRNRTAESLAKSSESAKKARALLSPEVLSESARLGWATRRAKGEVGAQRDKNGRFISTSA